MRLLYLITPFFLCLQLSFAQADSIRYMSAGDTILTELHPMGELLFPHTVQTGQTLFSLAKFYGLNLQELYAYNPHISQFYNLGDQLRIPMPQRAIITQIPPQAMLPGLAMVFYKVKKGDTLFGLTRRTFNVTKDWLLLLNPQISIGLKPDQLLHIGWMSTQGIPADWHEIHGGPYARMNHPMKLEYFRRSADKRLTEERGAATSPKEMEESSGFFCLHRSAPINSLVEIHNPNTRQTMYLKVSARLPQRVYDRNTLVVVSPLAAKALGAIDDRFYVHLKHY